MRKIFIFTTFVLLLANFSFLVLALGNAFIVSDKFSEEVNLCSIGSNPRLHSLSWSVIDLSTFIVFNLLNDLSTFVTVTGR